MDVRFIEKIKNNLLAIRAEDELLDLCDEIMKFSITEPNTLKNQAEKYKLLNQKIYLLEDNLITKLESEDWLNNLYNNIKKQEKDEFALKKAISAVNFFLNEKQKSNIAKYNN